MRFIEPNLTWSAPVKQQQIWPKEAEAAGRLLVGPDAASKIMLAPQYSYELTIPKNNSFHRADHPERESGEDRGKIGSIANGKSGV